MTTNPNNGGGRSNTHLPLPNGGSRYGHAFYAKNSPQTNEEEDKKILAMMFPIFAGIMFIVILLLCFCGRKGRQEQDSGEARDAGEAGRINTAPSSSTVATTVEMPLAEPTLVCTYREADGWQDATCGVCLAELVDGEALRVLPPCMHYFHDACVNEWLYAHKTCPLCRATVGVPPDTAA